MLCYLWLALLMPALCRASSGTCYNWTICTKCPSPDQYSYVATIVPLFMNPELVFNLDRAEILMNSTPGVISLDYGFIAHLSLNCTRFLFLFFFFFPRYALFVPFSSVGNMLLTPTADFCCLTKDQLHTVADLLQNFTWSSFNISFDKAVCNINGNSGNLGTLSLVTHIGAFCLLNSVFLANQ